jgi:hypothetical protein
MGEEGHWRSDLIRYQWLHYYVDASIIDVRSIGYRITVRQHIPQQIRRWC